MAVRIVGPKDYLPGHLPSDVVNTTSRSQTWSVGLSPFFVGPIPLYPGAGIEQAQNMENAWQYSKVYEHQVGLDGLPSPAYFEWARQGWASTRAERYPMGKGAVPLYSWWDGQALPYIEARKRIYFPLYAKAVAQTEAYEKLVDTYEPFRSLTLWDFDGYDHHALGMTFKDVLNCPTRKMGHAFVLGFLLERGMYRGG